MEATRDGYSERNKSGVQRQILPVFSHLGALDTWNCWCVYTSHGSRGRWGGGRWKGRKAGLREAGGEWIQSKSTTHKKFLFNLTTYTVHTDEQAKINLKLKTLLSSDSPHLISCCFSLTSLFLWKFWLNDVWMCWSMESWRTIANVTSAWLWSPLPVNFCPWLLMVGTMKRGLHWPKT